MDVLASSMRSETEDNPRSTVQYIEKGSYLSKPYADYTVSQKLEIEKSRLKFLKDCKKLKRPPPSLRISGAKAITDIIKLPKFSTLETDLLNNAISLKLELVNELRKLTTYEERVSVRLSSCDQQKMRCHFQRKMKFYTEQNSSKWSHWPQKSLAKAPSFTSQTSKLKNFKLWRNRKKRKTERDAQRALDQGSVVVMISEVVPLGAIALLGKGLNFIPTPSSDPLAEQLDMRLVQSKILKCANQSEDCPVFQSRIPSSLVKTNYGLPRAADESSVNTIVDNMISTHNTQLQKKSSRNILKKNITKDEESGLNWLVKKSNAGELAVVKADKGGALLIVYPELLRRKVLDKLENEKLYVKFKDDPTEKLYSELFDLWVFGKEKGFVSAQEASSVMGVTEKDGKSTSSHFKPGASYFYPMLKIHKLKKEEVTVESDPPARLVTALQEGITKRSDVFMAKNFIQNLERDFCTDLLKDTSSALLWLDHINQKYSPRSKKSYKSFTFDFKSLYDSLKPELVVTALSVALKECRSDWPYALKEWICDLVKHSLKSAVGKFEDKWYVQKLGIATGGSLCVELANITVYYVMRQCVYSNKMLMKKVKHVKRYIDDGAGFYTGSSDEFKQWLADVNDAISSSGLFIDEANVEEVGSFVPFLDILFCFNHRGILETDLYIKPTDSRSYLHFGSAHPKHVFSGTVYSQCLRLRRIIICEDKLKERLDVLRECFTICGYPKSLVNRISEKVLKIKRDLNVLIKTHPLEGEDVRSNDTIRIVSTFGTDNLLIDSVKEAIPHLNNTVSFKTKTVPVNFQFVKKTAPSIGSKLACLRKMSLGIKKEGVSMCGAGKRCQCCKVIPKSPVPEIRVNGQKVSLPSGTCKSKNIIYLANCKLCAHKCYIGRTVQPLNKRVNGHRQGFQKVVAKGLMHEKLCDSDDTYSLGIHLLQEHGVTTNFNDHFTFHILEHVSPSQLETKEHLWIHKLNTLYPYGINRSNPFGLPILKYDDNT